MTNTIGPDKIRVRVQAITPEGPSHRAITLAASDATPLPPFEAGAHVDVHLADHLVRQYSLAGAPGTDQTYLLCIKREPHSRGGSARLCDDLKAGDELLISPPRNLFRLEDADRYALVAAGIGITPILSMARQLEALGQPFVLHYYTRSRADTAFLDCLLAGFRCGNVVFHHSESGASLRRETPADLLNLPRTARLYVCGPAGFIERLQASVCSGNFPAERFHSECFAPPSRPASTVETDAPFDVEIASSRKVLRIPANCSIAQVLSEAGIAITLSCEQGMCGACLTPVLGGIPDHRDSVLSAREQASNDVIAICCSRSRSATLTLDL